MPFTPPKKSAFKQFLILDTDGVVSALSAIDGGQIDEILTRSAEEKAGGLGAEVNVKAAKAGGKRSKTRRVEEEIRRARTRHATAAKLLEALHAEEAIGVVNGEVDAEVASQFEPGMVIEFRAGLRLHPLHQADQMLRSFIEIAPSLDQKQAARELKGILPVWGVITGTGDEQSPILLEPYTTTEQVPRLIMPVPRADFEVEVDDVLGDVTIVAQVEQVIPEGQSHQVLRILRGGPATSLERGAIDEILPGLSSALSDIGIEFGVDDVHIHGPAYVLRSICAYR